MFPTLGLILWLAGFQIRPPANPPATALQASIQGIVIRAGVGASGAAAQLPDARVELKPGNRVLYTDADGIFTFRNVAPGQYTISGARDGFIPQGDPITLNVATGQNLKDLTLPMLPAPFISGKIFDPYGKPLAAALVEAYVRQYTPTGTQMHVVKTGMSDDLGAFRLFGLNFGDYYIKVGFGDRERTTALAGVQLSANVAKADTGYAGLFYDGADEIGNARAVQLAPGSIPGEMNIFFAGAGRFTVRGQVSPADNGGKIIFAPRGSDITQPRYFTSFGPSGRFEIPSVSPGAYVIMATNGDESMSSDVLSFRVADSDVDGIRLALEATVSIDGRVSLEGNPRPDLSALHVRLARSTNEFEQRLDADVSSGGSFTLKPVAPSTEYDITIDPMPASTYVKSIIAGGRNILSGKLPLLPSQPFPLQIVLAPAPDTLDIHVSGKGSDPAPGAQVVLIPNPSLRRRADRYVTGFTSATGDLHLTAVPPGEYTVYAFEHIDANAYYVLANNRTAEDRFHDRGVQVTVGQLGSSFLPVRMIPASETAGGFE